MLVLLIAGLVVLLVILLIVRGATGGHGGERIERSAMTEMPLGAAQSEAAMPPPERSGAARHLSTDYDFYLWDARRIASRGESRASLLDFFGYLVAGVAGLVALGILLTVLGAGDELTSAGRVWVVLSALGSVLALTALTALLLGFGALVRNSSRSLSISAGAALDSYEPTD